MSALELGMRLSGEGSAHTTSARGAALGGTARPRPPAPPPHQYFAPRTTAPPPPHANAVLY
ncbi:hypothetical protein RR48_15432 [Papilio machaon]|uniref:Uncharacterized protein n=1 Tax=Papilio machaon TaxID=76193 RepID=A0A194R0C4_PAPMA|nr:hypothetical protein RR48_15432 [Papilio machaon]